MTKAEIIARYGAEYYQRLLDRYNKRYREKHSSQERDTIPNMVMVKKTLPTPDVGYDLLSTVKDETALKIQKALRKAWVRISSEPHIIIVTAGNSHKGNTSYKCELYLKRPVNKEDKKTFAELIKGIEI
jgi:hypothetical protein